MKTIAAVLATAAVLVHAQGDTSVCDSRYDCEYAFRGHDGNNYVYDLAPLCREGGYIANSAKGSQYIFNICGNSPSVCSPKDYISYLRTGPTVQFIGDAPECTTKDCKNIETGEAECCTAPCEVLGYGPPIFELQDEKNPTGGGLRIKHIVAPPDVGDPYECIDPDTQQPVPRHLTYNLNCDPKASDFNVNATIVEAGTCNYVLTLNTPYACGCAPSCDGKSCGRDGCGGYCGSDALGGECPAGQACDASQVCRDPAVAPSSKYTKTPGDVAGGVFGGMFLGVFLFLACYFAYTKGYCAKVWSAVSGKGSGRGFSKMSSAGAGASAGTAGSSSAGAGTPSSTGGYGTTSL